MEHLLKDKFTVDIKWNSYISLKTSEKGRFNVVLNKIKRHRLLYSIFKRRLIRNKLCTWINLDWICPVPYFQSRKEFKRIYEALCMRDYFQPSNSQNVERLLNICQFPWQMIWKSWHDISVVCHLPSIPRFLSFSFCCFFLNNWFLLFFSPNIKLFFLYFIYLFFHLHFFSAIYITLRLHAFRSFRPSLLCVTILLIFIFLLCFLYSYVADILSFFVLCILFVLTSFFTHFRL